jgi:hypothetical protein
MARPSARLRVGPRVPQVLRFRAVIVRAECRRGPGRGEPYGAAKHCGDDELGLAVGPEQGVREDGHGGLAVGDALREP